MRARIVFKLFLTTDCAHLCATSLNTIFLLFSFLFPYKVDICKCIDIKHRGRTPLYKEVIYLILDIKVVTNFKYNSYQLYFFFRLLIPNEIFLSIDFNEALSVFKGE